MWTQDEEISQGVNAYDESPRSTTGYTGTITDLQKVKRGLVLLVLGGSSSRLELLEDMEGYQWYLIEEIPVVNKADSDSEQSLGILLRRQQISALLFRKKQVKTGILTWNLFRVTHRRNRDLLLWLPLIIS